MLRWTSLDNQMVFGLPRAVFSDGRVCISILHSPGDDPMGYESAAERWSPVQSVSVDESATVLPRMSITTIVYAHCVAWKN